MHDVSETKYANADQDQSKKESVAQKLSRLDENCKQLISSWKDEQLKLKQQHILNNENDFLSNLSYVGGVDISFPSNKNDLIHACACLVVMSYPGLEIVYKVCKIVHLTSIYVPEFLAFREVEPLRLLCEELKVDRPDLYPNLILVDGNGLLHPRKFGLACQLGVVLDTPTIGVAKKLFHVDGLEKNKDFKNRIRALGSAGSCFDITGESGFVYGKVLRSTSSSSNPIYVSIGHKVSLETCVDVVGECCKVRVPEPVRWADILSRDYIRENYEPHAHECKKYTQLNDYFQTISNAL